MAFFLPRSNEPPPGELNLAKMIRRREPLREIFNENRAVLVAEFEKDPQDIYIIKIKMAQLEKVVHELRKLDADILEQMLDNEVHHEVFRKERREIKDYDDRWIELDMLAAASMPVPSSPVPSVSGSIAGSLRSEGGSRRTFKLPRIEVKMFNGELTEWLSFWSQFQKIHDDETIHDSDKFQYLSQYMTPGTRAKDLVESYPQSAENYPKVIAAVKERFGKTKLLRQVYVRDLQRTILQNSKKKEDLTLSKLYDSLESKIRALDSLGVSVEITGEFLFPMVESSLPEDILIAWQRSSNFGKDGSAENPPKSELDYLMEFLRQEVECEEHRKLARMGFSQSLQDSSSSKKKGNQKGGVSTASSLHVSSGKSNSCIFCNKSHPSQECFQAMGMKLEEKNKILNEKKACTTCLRIGHWRKDCRIPVKCSGCEKKNHYHLMCPENPKNKKTKESSAESSTTTVTANQSCRRMVLLKTILVKINMKSKDHVVRILFDDGSQNSYIKKYAVEKSKCQPIGSYLERNALFGGVVSEPQTRKIYRVPLISLDGTVKRTMELADSTSIAGSIPKVPHGPWIKELGDFKICISDSDKKYEHIKDIDILVGADLMPQIATGRTQNLVCGLQAVETIFGWTLMGPVAVEPSCGLLATTIMMNESRVSELWDLEFLGIRDPIESVTKQEKDAIARRHFLQTVSRNSDGRYRVCLPWIGGVQRIPDNFKVAEQRLINATKKLKNYGKFQIYDAIFQQWLNEGFILEESSTDKIACHYVPHRPVYKPESKTTPVRPVFDASCKVGRNPSLNECLEKGLNLMELIPSIMQRFREKKIGIVSDIRKAFQMIEMSDRDQNYLRFLWWEDDTCQKLKVYKHVRVVFGVTCSPFILAAVIDHHLDNWNSDEAITAQKLKKSLYVDNCVTSVDTIEDYQNFKEVTSRIMDDAKMDLRMWEYGPFIGDEDQEASSTVLGMKWDKVNDMLKSEITPSTPTTFTKRTLLSTVNQVFDPMGFLSPAMITPKLILQESWALGVGWDDELPEEIQKRFLK